MQKTKGTAKELRFALEFGNMEQLKSARTFTNDVIKRLAKQDPELTGSLRAEFPDAFKATTRGKRAPQPNEQRTVRIQRRKGSGGRYITVSLPAEFPAGAEAILSYDDEGKPTVLGAQ